MRAACRDSLWHAMMGAQTAAAAAKGDAAALLLELNQILTAK